MIGRKTTAMATAVTTPPMSTLTLRVATRRASQSGAPNRTNDGTVQVPSTVAAPSTTSDRVPPDSRWRQVATQHTSAANPRKPYPRACRTRSSHPGLAANAAKKAAPTRNQPLRHSSTQPTPNRVNSATIDHSRARAGSTESAPGVRAFTRLKNTWLFDWYSVTTTHAPWLLEMTTEKISSFHRDSRRASRTNRNRYTDVDATSTTARPTSSRRALINWKGPAAPWAAVPPPWSPVPSTNPKLPGPGRRTETGAYPPG